MVTVKAEQNHGGVDGVNQSYDFISRYFAPRNGIPEDPVTGKYVSNFVNVMILAIEEILTRKLTGQYLSCSLFKYFKLFDPP